MVTVAGACADRRFGFHTMAARAVVRLLAFAPGRLWPVGVMSSAGIAEAQPSRPFPWETTYPPDLAWDLDISIKPLFALLESAVARFTDKPCVECLGRVYSYREIGRLVDHAAAGFQRLGVGPGVRVGLLLPNTPYYVICYYAVLRAGGTVVNLNPLYAAGEIRHQVSDSGIRVLVTVDLKSVHGKVAVCLKDTELTTVVVCPMAGILRFPYRQLFRMVRRRELSATPRDGRHLAFDYLVAPGAPLRSVEVDPQRDIAVLQYTGGVDGTPKASMLTHANLYASAVLARAWFPTLADGREVVLGVLPLTHVFGMAAVLNGGLLGGATLVLLPHPAVDEMLEAIQRRRVTFFPGVPTVFAMVAGHRHLGDYDLSSLRLCLSGGAPLPAEVQSRFEEATGCPLVEGYGLTETSGPVTCNPVVGERRACSVGLPLPRTVVEILAPGGKPKRPLPLGSTGEICVRGPQVMAGYWRQPDASTAVLRDGRLHTGDLGYLDKAGFLYIVGRLKPLILVGGYNVYPGQVEAAIRTHPAVAKASVHGMPDARFGERVEALIHLRPGMRLTLEELRAYLADRLAPFEMPRRVRFTCEPEIEAGVAPSAAGRSEQPRTRLEPLLSLFVPTRDQSQ
jgi:long-chain acyl-CoA synthetase